MADFIDYLSRRWDHLLELTVEHAAVTLLSVGIAMVIGVTLGLVTYRTERPRDLVLAVTAIFLTIPSLALFGLFMPIFGDPIYEHITKEILLPNTIGFALRKEVNA